MAKERIFGAELSRVEREFVFNRKNAGYVEYKTILIDGKKIRVVQLNPSPFMKSTKREYFLPIDGVSYPPKNIPIQFEVVREIDQMVEEPVKGTEKGWRFARVTLKVYESWFDVDIREILTKKYSSYMNTPMDDRLFSNEDLERLLQAPFRGDPFYINMYVEALGVYVHSSPPWQEWQGGVLEGAIGDGRHFSAMRFVLDLIPPEMRRKTSKYYYGFSKEQDLPPERAVEANICYFNPNIGVHLPLPLKRDVVKVIAKKDYAPRFEDVKPLMRAKIIDSILITPTPTCERKIEKATEQVVDLARDLGEPVPLQYALVVPKLSSSMARKERKFEIEKREIDKSLDLFENLFEEGIRMTKESSKFEIRKLSDDERLVYFTMKDLGGEKREITLKELKYNVEISEAKLKIALEMLRDRGLVYMPRRGLYRLVPLD
jgi:hypothetical protein